MDEPTAAPRAVSYATFVAWRERAGSLAAIEASDGTNLTLTAVRAGYRVGVVARLAGNGAPAHLERALDDVSRLAVGGVLSIWAARALSGVVFATNHLDVLNVGVPAAILMVAGLGAVLPAARRAARTDPLITLRSE